MTMDYLNQAMQARGVEMGGVAGMMRAAMDGHKQYKTDERTRLAAIANARGMGRGM